MVLLEDVKGVCMKKDINNIFMLLFCFFSTFAFVLFCVSGSPSEFGVVAFFGMGVFVFIFIMLFFVSAISKSSKAVGLSVSNSVIPNKNDQEMDNFICSKCGNKLELNDRFCTKCGTAVTERIVDIQPKVLAKISDFDSIFNNTDDKMLEIFINKELEKIGVDKKSIPSEFSRRKNIYSLIFSVLNFIYVSLIFFHFPFLTYFIGFFILVVFYIFTLKYNFMKYLKKEIKARPSEKISNIIMNIKNSMIRDNTKVFGFLGFVVSVILPLIIFINPVILYESSGDGVAVRYYAFGLTNFKSVTIPENHNGKKVVSLRGNTFSNMPFLEEVVLPDSITEIRGQAFKNDKRLISVNIPSKLEYLGGGAFMGCESITEIVLPDTLTFMGGEVFLGASSLRYVKLSNNLQEIRGNSFQFCSSLTSIDIPDSVTRIGGHAFQDDYALSSVNFTENSKLEEIGSSAFRNCPRLTNIILPRGVSINERSFKESSTRIEYFSMNSVDSIIY